MFCGLVPQAGLAQTEEAGKAAVRATERALGQSGTIAREVTRTIQTGTLSAGQTALISLSDNLITGRQALSTFVPNWRTELAPRLTPAQLDAVEVAFENTDAVFFSLTPEGQVNFIGQENWNYIAQFEHELHALERDFQITLRPLDWKAIFSGPGVVSPLRDVFTLLSTENFILTHEGKVPTASVNQEEHALYNRLRGVTIDVNKGKRSDPLAKTLATLKQNYRRISVPKSPQEWLTDFTDYLGKNGHLPPEGSSLYSAINNLRYNLQQTQNENIAQDNPPNLNVDPATLQIAQLFDKYRFKKTPAQRREELEQYLNAHGQLPPHDSPLYQAVNYLRAEMRKTQRKNQEAGLENINFQIDPNVLAIDQLFETYRSKVPSRTSQQIDEAFASWVEQYNRAPRKQIPNKTHEEYTEEERYESSLGVAIDWQRHNGDSNDPYVQSITARFEIFRGHASPRTAEEVYQEFLAYLKEFKTYPPSSSPLYSNVYTRMQYPQDTPERKKLSRLEKLARAAQRGERPWEVFDNDNPLARPRLANNQQPVASTVTQDFAGLDKIEQDVIMQTEGNYELLWQNFPQWLQNNYMNVVPTSKTIRALNTLQRVIERGKMIESISDVLAELHRMQLGPQADRRICHHLLFRGDNPNYLKPGDFCINIETEGIPREMARLAMEWGTPNVQFKADADNLYVLVATKEANAKDIREVIGHLHVPPGWEIRIGTHEIGLLEDGSLTEKARNGFVHLHLEKQTDTQLPEGEEDVSFALGIDLSRLIKGKSNTEILNFYKEAFRPYLSLY
ncbi:MAG: hypothetical protein MJ053_02710 [Elusimicrobiaceae bacterium]|nr:hypothetical protein [Elusimicrobiaceae bacterium]